MPPIHTEALNQARQIITREFGDLSDLPVDVRNTLANIYYRFCHMRMELEGDFAFPDTIALAGDLKAGLAKFAKERSHLEAAIETLPKIVAGMRMAARDGDRETCELAVQIFLDAFKYRIPDIDRKSSLRVKIERPFYAAKVDEVENLWRLI